MILTEETEIIGRKPIAVPLSSPQKPHGIA